MSADTQNLLADLVLALHVGFVAFVVLGLVAILCGGIWRWPCIRNPWFRAFHLGAISLVVIQAWLGIICPLTILENHLREKAGGRTYEGSFISHWLHKLIFFHAPPWVFGLCYTLFATAVVFSWLKYRPRPFRERKRSD